VRTDERADVGDPERAEYLFAFRRGKPVFGVLHVVVSDHRRHRVSSRPRCGRIAAPEGASIRPFRPTSPAAGMWTGQGAYQAFIAKGGLLPECSRITPERAMAASTSEAVLGSLRAVASS